MRNWLIALPAGILAVSLIAAGCGGGNNTSSLTKAEFIKKGDEICTSGREKLKKDVQAYATSKGLTSREPTEQEASEIAKTILIPSVRGEIEDLRDLGAPSGEEDQVDKVLSAVEDAVSEAEKEPVSLVTGSGEPFAHANALAHEYGFKVCGSSA